jgi:hypothetical protein
MRAASSKQIGEATPELLDDVRLDRRSLRLPYGLHSSISIREIEHEHVVQFFERDGLDAPHTEASLLSTRSMMPGSRIRT